MNRLLRVFPVFPSRVESRHKLPLWPAVSIVVLIVVAVLIPPGVVTVMNLYLLLLAAIFWLPSAGTPDRRLLGVLVLFGAILVIGLVSGAGADEYVYFKDAWYVSNPIIILLVGYVMYTFRRDLAGGLKAFVYAGTLTAIIYIVPIALKSEILTKSAVEVREFAGTGYYAPALAVTILLAYVGHWQSRLRLTRWIGVICFAICLASMAASFSRSILIVGLVGALAAAGVLGRHAWLRVTTVALIGLLTIGILKATVDTASSEAGKTFIGKLAKSIDEITIEEFRDLRSIQDNWRGYETARALRAYKSGTEIELIFGKGFGAEVDLGFHMNPTGRASGAVRYIPVFHNGYAYLLVKTGAAGVVLYLAALFLLYRAGSREAGGSRSARNTMPSRVMQAAVVSVVVTTWFIAGALNKLDLFSYMLVAGFLLAALNDGVGGRDESA